MVALIYKAKQLSKNGFNYHQVVTAVDSLYACAYMRIDMDSDYPFTVPILYYRLCILCLYYHFNAKSGFVCLIVPML